MPDKHSKACPFLKGESQPVQKRTGTRGRYARPHTFKSACLNNGNGSLCLRSLSKTASGASGFDSGANPVADTIHSMNHFHSCGETRYIRDYWYRLFLSRGMMASGSCDDTDHPMPDMAVK